MLKNFIYLPLFYMAFTATNCLNAEPFVVLQYNNASELSGRSNEFAEDPDHTK